MHRSAGWRLAEPASPADFTLVLGRGPAPACPYRRIRWPDFWVPTDQVDALAALAEAHRRTYVGERVAVACRGGVGRTGTALAALAMLDGLSPEDAVAWVRAGYHWRAVEDPVAAALAAHRTAKVRIVGRRARRARDGSCPSSGGRSSLVKMLRTCFSTAPSLTTR